MTFVRTCCRMLDLFFTQAFVYNETEGDYDLDLNKITLADYAAMYATVDPNIFCPNKLLTAFRICNGFAFALAMATIFLVAVVPVFVTRAPPTCFPTQSMQALPWTRQPYSDKWTIQYVACDKQLDNLS